MKLNIHPTVILRTPKFPYQANLEDCWDELKEAIAISSDAFYQVIKDVTADQLHSLPPKVSFTIWKYFNRAKYRSTPYGTFASFSIFNNEGRPGSHSITLNKKEEIRSLVDWPFKNNIHLQFSDLIQKNCFLFSNSSYYLVSDSIRYITCNEGTFELSELDDDAFVRSILDACLKPVRINELINQLGIANEDQKGFFDLLQDMHDLQLLFSNYDPNIIGEDYFERLKIDAENLPKYIIAQRNVKQGNLDGKLFNAIPGLLKLLQGTLPNNDRDALKKFITRFRKKFEQREISLLTALDPEVGVGYDELEQAEGNDDFIVQLHNRDQNKQNELDRLKDAFKKNINANNFFGQEVIFLNKLDLPVNPNPLALPNSTSLVMSVIDDLIYAGQIGGITANALTGRFSMADHEVERYASEIAKMENSANPDVLFFDVAYMVETGVDNVNRRKLIYDAQLAILNYDTSANPLALNDIQISVVGSEIFLRSKKLNKRLIPRMASAYNYSRSDLSVFRLLCDLQYHGLHHNLSLTLDGLFPGLDYYPRLQYQNIVISPKKWKIKKEDFLDPINKKPIPIDDCRNALVEKGISTHFKTGLADQTLCFSLNEVSDIVALIQYMQKQDSVYVDEVNLPQYAVVKDEELKPYLAQYILSIYNNQNIYRPSLVKQAEPEVKRVFPPGSEWLYFEIFCHQQRTDQLLIACIEPFLVSNEKYINKWFFIRYDENGNHLRLRVLLNDIQEGQTLISNLTELLESYLHSGLVSDIQVKTYTRELERYSANLIEDAESHFTVDSKWTLAVIANQLDNFSKYKICIDLAMRINQSGVLDNYEFINVVRMISDSFNQEHELSASDFKKLNAEYQLFFKTDSNVAALLQTEEYNDFTESFINLLGKCDEVRKTKMFSDLIHMHVNRLFNKNQRSHEMIIYYFLLKSLQRKMSIG